jgi:cytochrome P450
MRELKDAPFLDVFAEEFQADPAPVVEALRRETAVVQTAMGCMVITRDDVHRLLADPRLVSAIDAFVRLQGVTDGPVYEMTASSLLAVDGPDHARIRRIVSRAFTPKTVAPYRPLMRRLATSLIDGFSAAGRCEFMTAFAEHYPIEVMCHVIGVRPEDHERFANWGNSLTHILSLELGLYLDEVTTAVAGLMAYLDELIVERQAQPRDDLVSALIAATDDGDTLNPVELRSLLAALLFAGYDTTRNQLGLGLVLFCEHHQQWKLLAEQPDLAPGAVEEIMRVAGAISMTPRMSTEEIEVGGWKIPAGVLVSLSLAAANHDPAAYADPNVFDITVEREQQLTFGGGPHYCLGANLARAEMQEALPILAARMPDVAADGEPEWRSPGGIFGPDRLPLRFTPTPPAS